MLETVTIKEQLRKTVVRSGNGGAVWVPVSWLGEEVIITRQTTSLKERILKILFPYLQDIKGIYLYNSDDKETNILVITAKKINIKKTGNFNITAVDIKTIKTSSRYIPIIQGSTTILNAELLEQLKKEGGKHE